MPMNTPDRMSKYESFRMSVAGDHSKNVFSVDEPAKVVKYGALDLSLRPG